MRWPIDARRSRSALPLVTYFMFERWFLVPLPKGPIEDWLGSLTTNNKRRETGAEGSGT